MTKSRSSNRKPRPKAPQGARPKPDKAKGRKFPFLLKVILIVSLILNGAGAVYFFGKESDVRKSPAERASSEEADSWQDHVQQGKQLYKQAIGSNPIDVELVRRANRHQLKALDQQPNNSEIHSYLASNYLVLGELKDAIAHFEKADDLAPKFPHAMAHKLQGERLSEAGNQEEALGHFLNAFRIDPTVSEIHLEMGWALWELNRREEAIEQLKTAVSLNPADPSTQNRLEQYLVKKQTNEALAGKLRERLATSWDDPSVYQNLVHLADIYLEMNRHGEALEYYRRSVEINPNQPNVHAKIAICRAMQHEYDAALDSLMKTNPDESACCRGLAQKLLEYNRLMELMAQYERLMGRDDKAQKIERDAQVRAGKAREFLERSLTLDPEQPEVLALLRGLDAQ